MQHTKAGGAVAENRTEPRAQSSKSPGFIMLKRAFLKDATVPMDAKALAGLLAAFAGRDRWAWPSRTTLREITGWSGHRIGRVRASLLASGAIEREPHRRKGKLYGWRYWLGPRILAEPFPSDSHRRAQNLHDGTVVKAAVVHETFTREGYPVRRNYKQEKREQDPEKISPLPMRPPQGGDTSTNAKSAPVHRLSPSASQEQAKRKKPIFELAVDKRSLTAFGHVVWHFAGEEEMADLADITVASVQYCRRMGIEIPADPAGKVSRILRRSDGRG